MDSLFLSWPISEHSNDFFKYSSALKIQNKTSNIYTGINYIINMTSKFIIFIECDYNCTYITK